MAQRELNRSFSNLDKYVHKSQLPRIRLFFQLLGLGGGNVAELEQLWSFYSILKIKYKKQRALEIMQYILSFVGVYKCRIVELNEQALKVCKKALGYPSVVVGVCIQISNEDFKQLRTLGGEHLKCHPDNIETMEELCLLLHQKTSISSRDVYFLSQWLEKVDRLDLAKRLDEYAKTGVYEDPVINSSLGNGTFPQQPIQATSK